MTGPPACLDCTHARGPRPICNRPIARITGDGRAILLKALAAHERSPGTGLHGARPRCGPSGQFFEARA